MTLTPKADVAASLETFRRAQLDADATALASLCDDGLTYSHSEGRVEDKAACIANICSGKSRFARLDYRDPKIGLFGDVAIVRFHWLAAQDWTDGRRTETTLHILMVWRRIGNAWRLIARSATKLPA